MVLSRQIFRCVTNVLKKSQKTWRDSPIYFNCHRPKMNLLLSATFHHGQIIPPIRPSSCGPRITAFELFCPSPRYARPGCTQIFFGNCQTGPSTAVHRRGCKVNGVVHLQSPFQGPIRDVQITRPSARFSGKQASRFFLDSQTSRQAHFPSTSRMWS